MFDVERQGRLVVARHETQVLGAFEEIQEIGEVAGVQPEQDREFTDRALEIGAGGGRVQGELLAERPLIIPPAMNDAWQH